MSYIPQDGEDLIQCPYNKTHMIRIKRMPFHLMKCRREHIGSEYATCPYNARHEMPKAELRFHMTVCEDKRLLEMEISHAQQAESEDGSYFKGNCEVPTYFPEWNKPTPSENWDDEVPSVVKIGIDPKHLDHMQNPVYKDTTGMSPAEKKAFRLKLQRRHARIQQGLPPDENSDEENQSQPPQLVSQMRMPRHVPQVLQQQQQSTASQQRVGGAAKPTVFAYSLSKAGLGRGITANMNRATQGLTALLNNKSVGLIGQGRGAVRRGQGPPVNSAYMMNGSGEVNRQPQHSAEQFAGRSSEADENVKVLQAMSRGRGRGLANFTPRVGNPPGIQNRNTQMSAALRNDQFSDDGGGEHVFIVPVVKSMHMLNGHLQNGGDPEGNSSTDSSVKEDAEQVMKNIKKLQKKLKGIEHLEDKQTSGVMLNDEELEKLSKKAELEKMIQKLRL